MVVERAVPDGDELDSDAKPTLDVGAHLLERPGERVGIEKRGAVQPVAELALLATGEGAHFGRLGRSFLDQGQRLEHRIVEMGRDLGPLLRADPLGPFGGEELLNLEPTTLATAQHVEPPPATPPPAT